jgi:hypothetical protein
MEAAQICYSAQRYAYRWIGGHQRLKTEFSIFLEEIPRDYQGVGNVHTEHGIPLVTPR